MGAAKLTLTVKEESLPFVKKYAKRQHTSVSKLVQNLFDDITEKEKSQPDPILEKYKDVEMPQWIKNLSADIKIDPTVDYDEVKYEYLKKKYGL
jgi:Family of unknown function (DUF6364)